MDESRICSSDMLPEQTNIIPLQNHYMDLEWNEYHSTSKGKVSKCTWRAHATIWYYFLHRGILMSYLKVPVLNYLPGKPSYLGLLLIIVALTLGSLLFPFLYTHQAACRLISLWIFLPNTWKNRNRVSILRIFDITNTFSTTSAPCSWCAVQNPMAFFITWIIFYFTPSTPGLPAKCNYYIKLYKAVNLNWNINISTTLNYVEEWTTEQWKVALIRCTGSPRTYQ
jgi:hypothetical protein